MHEAFRAFACICVDRQGEIFVNTNEKKIAARRNAMVFIDETAISHSSQPTRANNMQCYCARSRSNPIVNAHTHAKNVFLLMLLLLLSVGSELNVVLFYKQREPRTHHHRECNVRSATSNENRNSNIAHK